MTSTCGTHHMSTHASVRIYRRPWRKLFRKQIGYVCWFCDVEIWEP